MAKVATPETKVPVPSTVLPSRKVTEPVGVPAAEDTVAVNVIGISTGEGFMEVASAMVTGCWETTSVTAVLVAVGQMPGPAN